MEEGGREGGFGVEEGGREGGLGVEEGGREGGFGVEQSDIYKCNNKRFLDGHIRAHGSAFVCPQ